MKKKKKKKNTFMIKDRLATLLYMENRQSIFKA